MKKLLVLALLVASPAFAQANGWAEMANGWGEMQTVPGFTTIPPPASATLGCVGVFLGSLTCVPGLTFASGTLSVPGAVSAVNFNAIPLPAAGAVTVTPKLSPLGGITVVAGSALVDGDSLSVGDGVGVVPIEFDAAPGDGTTGGAVAIVFDGTETDTQIRDAVKAILDGAGRDWTTSNQGADGIGLVRATPGASGGAITEDVTDAGFTVTDWTAPTAATTYTYSLQACAADGKCTAAGAASSTAAGVLTLSVYNPNRLSWSAVTGASSYKIRRDVGGATQGVIWSGTALTVDDTGLAGDSTAKPTVDGTGVVTTTKVQMGTGTQAVYKYGNGIALASTSGDEVRAYNAATVLGAVSNTIWINSSDLVVTRRGAGNLGLGVAAASPAAQHLSGQPSTGTSIVGGDFYLDAGLGTGNASGSAVHLTTPYQRTTSSTTAQTATPRVSAFGKWTTLTAGSATGVADIATPASGAFSGELYVLIEANDGTEYQSLGSRVRWSAATKATGNPVCTVSLVGSDLIANTSGTGITATFAVAAAAGKCTVTVNAASDLTETTLRANVQSIANGPGAVVSAL